MAVCIAIFLMSTKVWLIMLIVVHYCYRFLCTVVTDSCALLLPFFVLSLYHFLCTRGFCLLLVEAEVQETEGCRRVPPGSGHNAAGSNERDGRSIKSDSAIFSPYANPAYTSLKHIVLFINIYENKYSLLSIIN